MLRIQEVTVRLGFGRLEIRLKAAARLDLEVSVGWASPSSHGLRGGDALLPSNALQTQTLTLVTRNGMGTQPRAWHARIV
jgi:hypothetical protein